MPGAVASISAAGSYVLVQVDGHGEGLELPNEVARARLRRGLVDTHTRPPQPGNVPNPGQPSDIAVALP